ncbi:sporulation histidine kinase inhibitor Sda [Metabacillus bambusae]|uniref:Sporulation histidine kinase inhibitor Sda n=1 Tax=Metabacillus bambusae TaxID=2795218 RepID=A0ABS3MXL0_9BACI|nr:sporulation histidine kinase inhibitor Sda [Metabacillus bambusae]MBO1510688.1 sporulation histidine kinase inhibitor Sda [Metabacillus bambusae]
MKISNELLISVYSKAMKVNVDPYFIKLLKIEIQKRNLGSIR